MTGHQGTNDRAEISLRESGRPRAEEVEAYRVVIIYSLCDVCNEVHEHMQ